jgi:methylated-DNA-[protein]-cysteine S-methyltransferase
MMFQTEIKSPVGVLTLASDGHNLNGLWMAGQKYYMGTLPEKPAVCDTLPIFAETRHWLGSYFAGGRPAISELPLAPIGSAFRQEVWNILREIPYGEITTYGSIAKRLEAKADGKRVSAQAVGGAVGHNPIAIIIPCHRVVGADGSLTGYAGGLQTKLRLLELEGADLSGLYIPTKGTAL